MTIWDDLKPYWQLAGVALARRSSVYAVDIQASNAISQHIMVDGPGRVDFTPPETSALYIFSTVPAPFSATGDDLWLAPDGQISSITALLTPIARRQVLADISFHIISSPLATDSVQIDVCKAPAGSTAAAPTGLTLTVPANTPTSSFLLSTTFPVAFEVGDSLALRLRQSGTALQAAWNAYIVVG
jgi:hypothetical protein